MSTGGVFAGGVVEVEAVDLSSFIKSDIEYADVFGGVAAEGFGVPVADCAEDVDCEGESDINSFMEYDMDSPLLNNRTAIWARPSVFLQHLIGLLDIPTSGTSKLLYSSVILWIALHKDLGLQITDPRWCPWQNT